MGAASALIFNLLLFVIPVLGIQLLSSVYQNTPQQNAPSAEMIAETRRSIELAFEKLSVPGREARAHWADLVETELDARNVSAARGFLLAAPQLLTREDARAILAAAEDQPSGSTDQRLLRASLLFLPNNVRVGYEESAQPIGIELLTPEVPAEEGSGEPSAAYVETVVPTQFDAVDHMTRTPQFSVLGTVEDLADRGRTWIGGDRKRSKEFKLTGFAMTVDPSVTGVPSVRMTQAASVLKMALRAGRLDDDYARALAQRIDAAVPDAVLTENIENAFAEVAPLRIRAERVRAAFEASIDARAAARLGPELEQIGRIVENTSARGAITLISEAQSAADIHRARLIAQAGGDRAVALTSLLGRDAFSLTGFNLRWSIDTILRLMALVAAGLALCLVTLSAVMKMFKPKEKSQTLPAPAA